ncbi:MAG: hypothetical protein IKS24_10330 [Bacteroidaceae bacterium]|nr:hypothetical protein [Bacteroidaceae bacterium]
MSRLGDLYKAMETLRKEGLSLNEDLERQVSELEEDIIKKEILPVVTETIEPALKQVQRELVLVVDYHPGEPVSVSLSRKTNITELLDAKLLEQDPQVEHKDGIKRRKPVERINEKTVLRVQFPDGTVIQDKKAKVTFTQAIRKIGLMRVRNLNIAFCGVPIVSNTLDKKYGKAQVHVEGGLYVMTHSSTRDKKKQLDRISQALNLGLIVEEI